MDRSILRRISCVYCFLLFLSLTCGLTSKVTAQQTTINLNAVLNIKLDNTSVESVLNAISKKSGIEFSFESDDIRQLPRVSGNFTNISIKSLLDKCFANTTFKYTVDNNKVVIRNTAPKAARITVTGKILDTNKEPLAGAAIVLKGSGQGVSSAADGSFTFTFPDKGTPAILIVTLVGMDPMEVPVPRSMTGLTVTLKNSDTQIENIVVNGMFTRDKSTFTGSVTSIKGEDLAAISSTNLMAAISALTPGMTIVQNNSMGSNPNAVPEILIRGSNSIATSAEEKAFNNPLIILDGAEITMEELYDLDMFEIERVDVLKDAQAAIVYGDRAANGVIVIERTQVRDGKVRLSYNFVPELSIPDLSSLNLANSTQKLELERLAGLYQSTDGSMERAYNYKLQNIRRGVNTDWVSAPLRVPFSHKHSLQLSGRGQNIDYRASMQFSDKYGVMKGDNRQNYALNFSIGYHTRDKLTLRYSANYSLTDATDSPYGQFSAYTKLNPYQTVYDEYGDYIKAYYFDPYSIRNSSMSADFQANPLYNATLSSFSKTRNQSLRNTFDAKWYLTKNFYFTGQFNVDIKDSKLDTYVSPDDARFMDMTDPTKKGTYALGRGEAFNYDGKIVLNYSKTLSPDGTGFTVNAGADVQRTNATTSTTHAIGFLKDDLSDMKYALGYDPDRLPEGTEDLLGRVGFFASGNIYFKNRYFIDLSYRTSGSSVYGSSNRFAPMWSFGIGWNLHKEKFLSNVDWVNVLRLTWSLGYNGETTGSPYQALTTYRYSNDYAYYVGIGAVPIQMGNPELKWQRTLKNNIGINATLFKERLVASFSYFDNLTKDQLMAIPLPASTGAQETTVNFGQNQNRGYEFSLAGQIIRNQNWGWTMVINGTHVKDKIKKISNTLTNTSYQVDLDSPLRLRFREGGSQYDIYAVRSAGIDPSTGQEIFIKKSGEMSFKYDANDEVVVGNTSPKLQGAWLNTIRYKGWSLNIVFSYTFGGDTYNKTLWEKVENIDPRFNVDARAFTDRWKNQGDLSRFLAIKESVQSYNSERFVEKLNELWLSSATLSYEFQSKILERIGFKRLCVGVGVSDIARFSTVNYERGTRYPYCRAFNLMFRPTF